MYEYQATVQNVRDGDTVDLEIDLGFKVKIKIPLRLRGINTPELRDKNADVRAQAMKAKNRLIELLAKSPTVRIQSHKPYSQDKYGRWVADIFNAENQNVGEVLLSEKLAAAYPANV